MENTNTDQPPEVHSEDELYIGPDGQMHVDKTDGADETYLINSSSITFLGILSSDPDVKLIGKIGSTVSTPLPQGIEALTSKPPHEMSLTDLFPRQAAAWKGVLQNGGRTPLQVEGKEMWEQDLRLRQLIKRICRELQSGCIFVIHDQQEKAITCTACDHPYCQFYKGLRLAYLSIEPVIDWNSIAMAEEIGLFGSDVMIFRRINNAGGTVNNGSANYLTFCIDCTQSLWRGDGLLKVYRGSPATQTITSNEPGLTQNTQSNTVQIDNAAGADNFPWMKVQSTVVPQKRSSISPGNPRGVVKRKLSVLTSSGGVIHSNAVEPQEEVHRSLIETGTDNQSVDKGVPDSLSLDGSYDGISKKAAVGAKLGVPSRKNVTRSVVQTAAARVGSLAARMERASSPINRFSAITVPRSSRGSSRLSTPVAPSMAPSATPQPIVSRVSQLPWQLPELWCTCQREYDGRVMIRCNNDYCKVAWYHPTCLGLRETDDLPDWLCPQCISDKKESAEWWYISKVVINPPPEDPYGLTTMSRVPVIEAHRWSRGPPPTLISPGYGMPMQPETPSKFTTQEQDQVEELTDVVQEKECGTRRNSELSEDEEIEADDTGFDGDLDSDSSDSDHHMRVLQSIPHGRTPQEDTSDRPSTSTRFTAEQQKVLKDWFDHYVDGPPTLEERKKVARELEEKTGLTRDQIQNWMYRNITSSTRNGKWHQ